MSESVTADTAGAPTVVREDTASTAEALVFDVDTAHTATARSTSN